MIPLSEEEAGRALGIPALRTPVTAVSIDTRTLREGDLFVALRGERFDGHDFVARALSAGACGAVVEEKWWADALASEAVGTGETSYPAPELRSRVYPVPDTLLALAALARAVRRRSGAKVIAVTGSVGKTGTKDLIAAMAARAGGAVSTAANQNNEVGVPLTLLSLQPDTAVAVVEMGMRGRGQIAALAATAEPDVGVITNIHPVHLELLGSLEHIAEAKAELLAGLAASCVGVVPAGCAPLDASVDAATCRIVRFDLGAGADDGVDVRGTVRRRTGHSGTLLALVWPGGEAEVEVPFASRHRLENTVAAVAACYGAGLSLPDCLPGLREVVFTPGRGDVVETGHWVVVNDTYNANPAAVRSALDDLVDLALHHNGRAVAVLGDMLELGPEAERFHEECGAYAAEAGVRQLWAVGLLSRATTRGFNRAAQAGQTAGHVETVDDVNPVLAGLRPGDVVLFKASRSVGLEAMVAAVVKAGGPSGDAAGTGRGDEP